MIQIFGFLDIISAVILALVGFEIPIGIFLGLIFGLYLLIKGGIFLLHSFNIASLIDVLGGIILILGIFFNIPSVLLFLGAAAVFQKGVFTFL